MSNFVSTVVLPVSVLLGIALLCGVFLVLLSQVFSIEKDERAAEIERLLAGTNCGGCGQAGCAAFAQALMQGTASLDDCNSTPSESKNTILKLLSLSGDIGEDTVAVIHCNGGNFCLDKYEYQGYGDCSSAEMLAGGTKMCDKGCMGLATCSKICPHFAIEMKADGFAYVNRENCTSCGACIRNCPKNLITRIPRSAPVYVACSSDCKGKDVRNICSHGCIGCSLCVSACPVHAITLTNNLPVIDYELCYGCLKCVHVCPTKVIKKH